MKEAIIFSPPIIFAVFLGIFALAMAAAASCAPKKRNSGRALDPYACGHRDVENYVNPNYSQFFRFAIVFTVMHVIALVITTAPLDAMALPLAYVAAGVLTLVIIFRK